MDALMISYQEIEKLLFKTAKIEPTYMYACHLT